MQVDVDDTGKTVRIWLTKGEKDDPGLRDTLRPLYRPYREKGYLVAVFLSGENDLYQGTRDLLLYNRRRAAEKEVLAEREAATGS